MSSRKSLPLAVVIAAASFATVGCNTANRPIGTADPFLGEAVKYNAAVQTIDPAPVYTPESTQPGSDGAKGAAAVKRYRTDQVKDVETMETTSGTSGTSTPPR